MYPLIEFGADEPVSNLVEKRLEDERDVGGEDAIYKSVRKLRVRATGEMYSDQRVGLGEDVESERVGGV